MAEYHDDRQESPKDKAIVQYEPKEDQSFTTKNVPEIESLAGIEFKGEDTLLILLPGQTAPLMFTDKKTITLGRYDHATGISPTVDLTPYFGVSMGVSRRHAEIFLQDGHYFIKDLASANGTWLNNQRISQPQMIKSGDQLRMGELLAVLFLSEKDAEDSSEHVHLTGRHRLFVQYLATTKDMSLNSFSIDFLRHPLSDYLEVLSDIQTKIFAANKQPNHTLKLSSLKVVDKLNTIEIQLDIHYPLLLFLRDEAQRLVTEHQQNNDDTLSPMLFHSIAKKMLEKVTTVTTEHEDYVRYLDRLQKDLQKLFLFHLKIINVDH